jgi:hypothetical protein
VGRCTAVLAALPACNVRRLATLWPVCALAGTPFRRRWPRAPAPATGSSAFTSSMPCTTCMASAQTPSSSTTSLPRSQVRSTPGLSVHVSVCLPPSAPAAPLCQLVVALPSLIPQKRASSGQARRPTSPHSQACERASRLSACLSVCLSPEAWCPGSGRRGLCRSRGCAVGVPV